MLTTILTINGWAEGWLKVMGAVLWQSVLLVGIAALIALCLRRSSPVVRYWLWQIVAVKLLLMPFWSWAVPFPTWWETSLPRQTAMVQPEVMFQENLPRPMVQRPLEMAEKPVPSVARLPSFGEKLGEITWRAWLLAIWVLIVFWQIVRLVVQRFRLAKLLGQAVPTGAEIAELTTALAAELGLRRVPLTVCVAGDCPLFVCGLRRPRLVLPGQLMASLDPAQRRQVILHELAHIKRHDLIWGWPVEIARIVYFFNPLIYWTGYQLRLEQELACDQLAMARSGHSAAEYAKTLVQVVSHASQPASVQAAAIAAGLTGSETKKG